MNDNDFKSESQKYMDEMMKFYSMNKNASLNTAVNTSKEDSPNNGNAEIPPESISLENESGQISEDIADESLNSPMTAEENMTPSMPEMPPQSENNSFENRFPPPVIPEFIRDNFNEPISSPPFNGNMNSMQPISMEKPKYEMPPTENPSDGEYGFLKVEVRTGENGFPVPNAAVTVSRKQGDGEELLFTGATDMSGAIERIKLPAPSNLKGTTPESFQSYAVYNVSAFSKGFYREVSAEVPVFAGVTSIQRFNLIPEPFNYDDKGQSLVFENTEPQF